jgi:hypothetical protein
MRSAAAAGSAGLAGNQLIVRIRGVNGRVGPQYVCTYDRDGRVLSLQPPAPVDKLPIVNGQSILWSPLER